MDYNKDDKGGRLFLARHYDSLTLIMGDTDNEARREVYTVGGRSSFATVADFHEHTHNLFRLVPYSYDAGSHWLLSFLVYLR